MPSRTIILCPGQGAQTVGMGNDLYQSSPAARAVFDQANSLFGSDLSSLCFNGPAQRLNQTDVSQPALYVTAVASFHAAVESGAFDAEAVTAYAGLSLGEYTALHLAGVFSFDVGLHLVSQRGKFMQEAALASPSGMVAVIGADEPQVRQFCDQAAAGGVLVPANFNAPGQIVISGDKEACARAVGLIEAAGFRAAPLAVAGAFHSPLMRCAADRMNTELAAAEFRPPARLVYSNVTAQPHGPPASIKQRLVEQITQPVRWEQTMTALVGGADPRCIELAPGRTLAGLLKRLNRRLPVEENAAWQPRISP